MGQLKSETKVCPVCQRLFSNRKRWRARGQWETVRYCSTRCRQAAAKKDEVFMITIGDTKITKSDIRDYVRTFDVVRYAKTRNQLAGGVSYLSPYITRGVCSPAEVAGWVLERNTYAEAEKFIQELAWREYWQQVWWVKDEAIFSDLRFSRDDWQHTDLVAAIVKAETGITAIDSTITELYSTGYMHNQGRLWVAMLACNIAKAHWFNMSRWLYYYLLDGDLASNMLSWQWVAGTNAGKRHYANQAVINACAASSQAGTYLDCEKEQLPLLPIPAPLTTSTQFSYTSSYPDSDTLPPLTGNIHLYSPWTLDPAWRLDEGGIQIVVIEPRWFDRFPVSAQVMEFIVEVAKTQLPQAFIYVGDIETLSLSDTAAVYRVAHPVTKHWPGQADSPPRLFPPVTGYYPSFFKFWQACQKSTLSTSSLYL